MYFIKSYNAHNIVDIKTFTENTGELIIHVETERKLERERERESERERKSL